MSKKAVIIGSVVAAICLCVVVLLFFAVSHMIRTDPSKARLLKGRMPVTLTSAKVEQFNYVIGASGQTQEFEKVVLTAKVSQPVEAVRVEIGNIIYKEQVLVELQQNVLRASVNQAKSAVTKAKSNLEYSNLNYQRFLNLFKQNLIAKVELEEADQRVKLAEYDYYTALRELEWTLQDLSYATVKSPTTGIVLDRPINVGEIPKIHAQLLSVGIVDKIFMLAKVAEEKVSHVQLKMSAEVLFDAFPNDPFKGEITRIDPNTDPKTRTFIAYIEISNKDLKLTPGLTGFARINYRKISLVVPSISVINPVGENATVFVVGPDSTARIKRVKTGLTSGGMTEILEGLQEGDKVAFAGVQALQEGDKVEVIESKL
jgi:RND family efflux transporter MFP subunit